MKKTPFTLCLLIVTSLLNAQTNEVISSSKFLNQQTLIGNGIGLGYVLAIVISWSNNKSILWAIIHGIFGWFYVIYYALTRNKD